MITQSSCQNALSEHD